MTFQKKPTITVLCGSSKFQKDFHRINWDLTNKGEIVLAPGVYNATPAQKEDLDELHRR